jgi:hypothetical protein
VPLVVPILGLVSTVYMVVQFTADAYLRAGALVLSGAVLYVVQAIASRRDAGVE